MGLFNPKNADESTEASLINAAPSPAPEDAIRILITPWGTELALDPKGLPPKAVRAIKRGKLGRLLRPLFWELWGGIRARLLEQPGEFRETSLAPLTTVIAEEEQKMRPRYHEAIKDFAKQYEVPHEKLAIPISPPVRAGLQAIMNRQLGVKGWEVSQDVKPYYTYTGRDGHITITFEAAPETGDAFKAIWETVGGLSTETAIVFCILLERIARLWDPRGIAIVTWKDIAKMRGVGLRQGRAEKLREDIQNEILRLAALRLSMVWRDYRNGGIITFGAKEHPDRLIDLVEVQYEKDRKTASAFSIRAGQALSHFLSEEKGGRWIGYFSRALLQIDPYREALVWKLGAYWTLTGMVVQKKGGYAKASPEIILETIGEVPDLERPGRTIERFIKAHRRLVELDVLKELPRGIESQEGRGKERLRRWLQTPITAKLHPDLWERNPNIKRLSYAPRTAGSPIVAENSPIMAENSVNI